MHSLYKAAPRSLQGLHRHPQDQRLPVPAHLPGGAHGVPVEVQIRTEFMDQMADKGVAAHWAYKRDGDSSGTTAQIRAQRWMQSLLELQQSAGSSFGEIHRGVKTDLFPDEDLRLHTGGRIMELPAGATPVDFAYTVHTDIGHACVGSRVDRHPIR